MVEASGECCCNGKCGGELTCLPGTYGPDDPGGGRYIERLGTRKWYNPPHLAPSARGRSNQPGARVDILAHWPLVELDLHSRGIDVESDILHHRSWSWLQLRISDLLVDPTSRLYRTLHPKGA